MSLESLIFFITDKIKKGEVNFAFCPTVDILGDYLPNRYRWHFCVLMRENVLNLPVSTSTCINRSVLDERNEKRSK